MDNVINSFVLGISKLGVDKLGSNGMTASEYYIQLLDYFPNVIRNIREFKVLAQTESVQLYHIHSEIIDILANAYVSTADIERITEWENWLEITPLEQGEDSLETWLQDRRETILARLYQPQKLNSETISNLVKIFTGGVAMSYFKDGIVYVFIELPADYKGYKLENVEQELRNKIPAHLGLQVKRSYHTWSYVQSTFSTWGDVKDNFSTWEDILPDTIDN